MPAQLAPLLHLVQFELIEIWGLDGGAVRLAGVAIKVVPAQLLICIRCGVATFPAICVFDDRLVVWVVPAQFSGAYLTGKDTDHLVRMGLGVRLTRVGSGCGGVIATSLGCRRSSCAGTITGGVLVAYAAGHFAPIDPCICPGCIRLNG